MSCPRFRGGQSEDSAAALMSAWASRLIAVDLRRVCARAYPLWSWGEGGRGSQGDLNLYCRFPGSLHASPKRRSLFLSLSSQVFSSSPLPFIKTATPVVFSGDYFLRLFLCLLNSLFCHRIYCFLYLVPSGAFYTFSIFLFFSSFFFTNPRQTNKKRTSFVFSQPTNEQPRPWQTHAWL